MPEDKLLSGGDVLVEQFADVRILRYRIPGFEKLSVKQKKLLYCLSEAALWGRDILFDQHYRHNLLVRQVLEDIYRHQQQAGEVDGNLELYLKRVWFSNGIHHHYSTDKLVPAFTFDQLTHWVRQYPDGHWYGVCDKDADEILAILNDVFYTGSDAKRVCLDGRQDLVQASASNFYQDVTQTEVEAYYARLKESGDNVSFGLNSTVVKRDGALYEEVWHASGRYGKAIGHIVAWLTQAAQWAENSQQEKVINLLVDFYESGNLHVFDQYNIEWLKDHQSNVDFINGFIEVYADPLGIKGTWESLVQVVDHEATLTAALISENAQWFEDRSPVNAAFRKKTVSGVSMKVINAVMLGGDCYPATPIGVNLPNADWLRETYGSKSITLSNVTHAHYQASLSSGVLQEFAFTQEEICWHQQFGALGDDLHTHLHECLGHGSGAMNPGVKLEDLKAYGSVIEETRADLYALYFMADDKMLELGLVPDERVYKAHYNAYLRNGLLVQLARIEPGKDIEQAHMRNRQLIGNWILERCSANGWVKIVEKDGKHYVSVTNHLQLRLLFGELLGEVQRIKSTGDYQAARDLVECYGVKVDRVIHQEVLERYAALGVAPYSGFVNPRLVPVMEHGAITDVVVDYTESYADQMMRYSQAYSVGRF
ncbi:MAG: dipeptidyl-peptidase 3 family protein [Breznakibacter sp.]